MDTRTAAPSKLMDQLRFLRSWAMSPLKTGAVAPSGPHLTRAMAAAVDPSVPGPIIELGPGTGVVTTALIERGVAESRIVAIEYNPDFAALLRQRFPAATILTGDAYAIADTVKGIVTEPAAAVVSSLPLFTQPQEARLAMVAAAFDLMRPGVPFVQFSYALVSPVPDRIPGMRTAVTPWIWRNIPPARVWTYRRG
jgi:phosphatidylethanolamine/phosphatidyl-N-methylethanolamine N-methyltransferase